MHELLLISQIPPARHLQLLNILAGISAMQPVPVLEKHLVFKPNKNENKARGAQVGGAQDVQKALQKETQGEVFYVQLVGERDEGAQDDIGERRGERGVKWSIQFRDIPEVVRQRPVTSRLVADVPIGDGDPAAFMEGLDYSYVSSYYLSGHRFTHLNTSFLLYRVFLVSPTAGVELLGFSNDLSKERLLDPSGSYVIQASIRVQDGSKVEMVNRGMTELLNVKETLKGVVDLDVGDRLAMDTRVR